MLERFPPSRYLRPFVATGFLGAYTTYSTFAVETVVLVKDGHALAWLAFVVAGAVGAPLRYLVDGAVADRTEGAFPWGTFVVNASGSLILGFLTGLALSHAFPDTPKVVLGTGFCGAYTTFSTFTFETVQLIEEGAVAEAFLNVVSTVLTCVAAGGLGLALASL